MKEWRDEEKGGRSVFVGHVYVLEQTSRRGW